ncbi:Valine--tRNA ligase [Lasiodiplodia theobromae]|uniref:Valine--tRNA ligase, mitochondrial n=1 Tax=Lasiodiplodia theobromae TaxID=45133 RepID=A0A5N5D081_9PEZI|nr:Valine--tRNA ligase [Lasiodiplodia theobromae]
MANNNGASSAQRHGSTEHHSSSNIGLGASTSSNVDGTQSASVQEKPITIKQRRTLLSWKKAEGMKRYTSTTYHSTHTHQSSPEAEQPEAVEEIPPGDKKILRPIDAAYMPQPVESAWYAWWKKAGFFEPRPGDDAEVFSIPMPPPNITGALHMGHALAISIQDTLVRWNRMLGKKTLWTPGCDHAGIATQNVVENMLLRREGRTRHDIGRERFIELAHEWKEEHHVRINDALQRMGASVDWTREAFTMDDNFTAAVQETFVRLHEEGLIYRSDRLVNWCPKLNTAISNLEVVNMEIGGRTFLDVPGYEKKIEFGVLHHINYPIVEPGGAETIEIATTRPESIFGDTGIAVHPQDSRYQELIGKHAKHPFLDRLLPIVADESVSMDFGTGAVKVTPAHDFNDFAVGQRHGLDIVSIFNDDGTLNDNAGSFSGMKRFDARPAVIEQLKAEGLSKDFIERRLKPQWWMKTKEMANAAAQAVKDEQIKILPETAEKSFSRWMDECQDWCLSRQLWWGHRVPAYFVDIDGQPANDDNARWVTGRTESEARAKAAAKFPGQTFSLRQDPDVLDTWLSAALWPFASLGWPKETTDLKTFYPQSVLETGWDILFFWVARMVMLGLQLTGQVPFKEVYCHSLVRDSDGRKMSKSLGNVIDPVDVMDGIELQQLHAKLLTGNLDPKELATATKYQKTSFPQGIPDCGADALRFNLLSYMTGGGDINFDVKLIHANRRFCNKIFQATKYVLGKLGPDFIPSPSLTTTSTPSTTASLSLADRWILHKLATASRAANAALSARDFASLTSTLYQFWDTDLCRVYIEKTKRVFLRGTEAEALAAKHTLYDVLDAGLRLVHPVLPFLSEEMWQRLPRRAGDATPSVMVAAYPVYDASLDDAAAAEAYELLLSVAKAVRSLLDQYAVKQDGVVYLQLFDGAAADVCREQFYTIRSLVGRKVTSLTLLGAGDAGPAGCIPNPVSRTATAFLQLKGQVDIDAEVERATKKLGKAKEVLRKQQAVMQSEKYKTKASQKVREIEEQKLGNAQAEVEEYSKTLSLFQRLKLEL